MVDFDNEATIGTPAVDVERISILQRRYDLFEALEDFKKKKFENIAASKAFVQARLLSLFLELQGMLCRQWFNSKDQKKVDRYTGLKNICLGRKKEINEEDIFKSIYIINGFLDKIRLTRVDTQVQYNPQDMEKENKIKGF